MALTITRVNVKAINLQVHRLFQHRDTWRTCVLICETHKMLGMLVHLGMRDWGLLCALGAVMVCMLTVPNTKQTLN